MGLLFHCGSLNLLGYFCLCICWFHLSSVFVDVSLLGYSIELKLLHWTQVCWTRDVILLNSLKMVLTNKIVNKIVLFCTKKKKSYNSCRLLFQTQNWNLPNLFGLSNFVYFLIIIYIINNKIFFFGFHHFAYQNILTWIFKYFIKYPLSFN